MGKPAFDGQRIWITGASSGIGEALAYALAGQGARLVLSARRVAELERVRAACAQPEQHLVYPLDMAVPDSFAAAVQALEAQHGPIDVLILNAGIAQRSWARDTSVAVDRQLMTINFLGPIALSKALLPSMLVRGQGRLVVISSVMGKVGTPRRTGYAASKHALHGYFDSLRAELAGSGIRIQLVCPGFIHTQLPHAALLGDGSPQGHADALPRQGLAPARCAQQIVRGLARGRDEFCVGGAERHATWLGRWFPGLYRWLLRRVRIS